METGVQTVAFFWRCIELIFYILALALELGIQKTHRYYQCFLFTPWCGDGPMIYDSVESLERHVG